MTDLKKAKIGDLISFEVNHTLMETEILNKDEVMPDIFQIDFIDDKGNPQQMVFTKEGKEILGEPLGDIKKVIKVSRKPKDFNKELEDF